jgi:hypothetical protein
MPRLAFLLVLLAACASQPKPAPRIVNLSAILRAAPRGSSAVVTPDPHPITPTNPPLPTNPKPKETP